MDKLTSFLMQVNEKTFSVIYNMQHAGLEDAKLEENFEVIKQWNKAGSIRRVMDNMSHIAVEDIIHEYGINSAIETYYMNTDDDLSEHDTFESSSHALLWYIAMHGNNTINITHDDYTAWRNNNNY